MKKNLQYKYDSLFQAGWRPPLQSRRDLMEWACAQQNAFLSEKEAPADMKWNCENPGVLIDKFGPDYNAVRAKLGYVKGLFRE